MAKKKWILACALVVILAAAGAFAVYRYYLSPSTRTRKVIEFIRNPENSSEPQFEALSRCGDAPFVMPTSGLIGFIWGDSFRIGASSSRD